MREDFMLFLLFIILTQTFSCYFLKPSPSNILLQLLASLLDEELVHMLLVQLQRL